MNLDARRKVYGRMGFCVVFLNENGGVMALAISSDTGSWTPPICETKAILFGFRLAWDLRFLKLVVETDCLYII